MAVRRPDRGRCLLGAAAVLLLLLVALGAGGGSGSASADGERAAAAVATSRDCPLPASAVGLCGSVAGIAGWYGSWTTADARGAYCLEHDKAEPRPELAYDRYASSAGHVPLQAEAAARLGYLLGRYGATRDPVRAAALAVLAHASVGDSLTTSQLASYRTDLDPRVRTSAAALWDEAAKLHGPYRLTVTFTGDTVALAHLASASGHDLPDVGISWSGSTVVASGADGRTDAGGNARLHFSAGAPGTRQLVAVRAHGLAADDVAVWVPHDPRVQTVAVALPVREQQARAERTLPVAPPAPPTPVLADVTISKSTTSAWVSPAQAVFHLVRPDGTRTPSVTVDGEGHAPALAGLAPGPDWTLVEDSPCRDCLVAPPRSVLLPPGRTELRVVDETARHHLRLRKTAPDGTPLSGGVFSVLSAPAPGAPLDAEVGTCTTDLEGRCEVAPQGVASGLYQVTEVRAAPGTVLADEPVRQVRVDGADLEVVVVDRRATTVAFVKTADAPGAVLDPAHVVLAGAVFVVSETAGAESGRCTTDAAGACSLPPGALVEGRDYTWAEATPPPGLLPTPGSHPLTATWPVAAVRVADSAAWVPLSLIKTESGGAGVPVPGALVDLCASGLPAALAATWHAPAAASCQPGETWVGAAATGADGTAGYGVLPPGARYCARERTAPAGWQVTPEPVCADTAPAAAGQPAPPQLTLALAEQRVPLAPSSASPSPTPAPVQVLPAPPVTRTRTPTPTPASSAPLPRPVAAGPVSPRPAAPPALPLTGSSGVVPLTLAGAALLAAGAAATLLARRRQPPSPVTGVPPTWRGGWVPGVLP